MPKSVENTTYGHGSEVKLEKKIQKFFFGQFCLYMLRGSKNGVTLDFYARFTLIFLWLLFLTAVQPFLAKKMTMKILIQ